MLSCMHLVLEQLLQCNAQTFVELLRMGYNLEIQNAAVTKTGTHTCHGYCSKDEILIYFGDVF